ncbi:MAG: hypothetical protein ACFFBP_05065 [Promethearchaeota archaeon]
MRKSIGLAFGFSLLFILLMNFLFFIIANAIEGSIEAQFNAIAANPYYLCYRLAQPMGHFPWDIVGWINSDVYNNGDNLRFGLMLVAIIGGAIIAGIAGGSIKNAIIGWVITCIILIILIGIAAFNVQGVIYLITGSYTTSFEDAMIWIVLRGIFNTIIYGLLTVLVALIAGKSKSY